MSETLFTLDPAPTFTVPVRLTAPGGVERELHVTYRHMPKSRAKVWREETALRPEAEEPDILLEVMADWSASEMLTRESLVRLLDNHYRAGEELYLAYLSGLAGARQGN